MKIPVVFSCSGCSFAGQMANTLAVSMNKIAMAEMSCLAGIAAGKKPFFKKIENRKIWIIDGCSIECGKQVLADKGIIPDFHIQLPKFGVPKFNIEEKEYNPETILTEILNTTGRPLQ